MSQAATATSKTDPPPPVVTRSGWGRAGWLLLLTAVLAGLILLGFFVGSGDFSASQTWHAL